MSRLFILKIEILTIITQLLSKQFLINLIKNISTQFYKLSILINKTLLLIKIQVISDETQRQLDDQLINYAFILILTSSELTCDNLKVKLFCVSQMQSQSHKLSFNFLFYFT